MDEEERKHAERAKMSDMMRQGQSTLSIFEQMYMQSLQESAK